MSGEGSITHARLREMTTQHSRNVTLAMDSLVRRKILERGGRGRAAYYFFPGEPPAQDGTALSFFVAAPADAANSEHSTSSSEHSASSFEHSASSSEHSHPTALGVGLHPCRQGRVPMKGQTKKGVLG